MIGRHSLFGCGLLVGALFCAEPCSIYAFTAVPGQKFMVSATAVVGNGLSLTIQADPLPGQAFFGKNVVIPVTVTAKSRLTPSTVRVNILYWLSGPNGGATTPTTSVPISFAQDPTFPNRLLGTAIIPASQITDIRHGGKLQYIFQAPQGGSSTLLTLAGPGTGPADILAPPASSFGTEIIDHICQALDPSRANTVSAPDLFAKDGRTAVTLAPGSLMGPGELCIKQEDPADWPLGPGHLRPVAIYTITLNGTSLSQTAQLTLSYPADIHGKVLEVNSNPSDLAIYWLGPEGSAASAQSWRPLSRNSIDLTLHTVTGGASHFSTFALIAAGSVGRAASLRPQERIITPNGDGINDTITFSGLTPGQDEVRIFDVRGRRVREFSSPPAGCGGNFCWDGRDDGGSIVESGVYIYQFTLQGDRVSGVVAVAK